MPVIPAVPEAKAGESRAHEGGVAVSQDRTTALEPGLQSKTLSQKKKRKKERKAEAGESLEPGRQRLQ